MKMNKINRMSAVKVEKLKKALAIYFVYHEKVIQHEILPTMQIPSNYILESYPNEVMAYIKLLDEEYGMGAVEFVHCKECRFRGSADCICHPIYPEDGFYCAKGEEL
jgi:hypothetical protein